MRKITFTVLLGLAVAGLAAMEASVAWTSKTLDLGQVSPGETQSLSFQFVNESDQPLKITEAVGSCGCTRISYPKESVKPGESASISAEFTSSRPGVFQKNIRVKFAGEQELTYLYFKGEVVN